MSRKTQIVYSFNAIFLVFLSTLDLIGITFVLLLMSNLNSNSADNIVINFPILNDSLKTLKLYSQNHLTIILVITILLFTSKSLIGVLVNFLNTRILSIETQKVTGRLIKTIFGLSFSTKTKYSSHDYSYALSDGVRLAVLDTLYSASVLFSDILLTLLITINLIFVAKVIFIPTFLFFVALFFLLNQVIKRLTHSSFAISYETDHLSRQLIQETVFSNRELKAAGVSEYYLRKIAENRGIAITAHRQITFSVMLPKYVYEVGLFLGIALIALFTNIFGDSTKMILNVTLFILSSSRIVPALLRIQYFLTTLTKAVAQSSIIFEILKDEKNKNSADLEIESEILRNKLSDFIPSVAVEKVSFAYPNNPAGNVITDISLRIGKGQFLSIVGRSGSGKSTLLDLILGNLEPATGTIFVSGVSPVVASQVWPRKISYVPQKVTILSGDIYENIALGQSKDLISRNLVEQVLKNVQLFDYFNSIPEGFGKNLGELGSHLSGGQLQRIGIARALYSDSELLVFDESMSALDAQSEATILEILSRYRGDKTIIMVTHRLSALQQVDTIVYMDSGKILCTGDFLAVQQQVPDFAEQVKLQSFDLWKIEE